MEFCPKCGQKTLTAPQPNLLECSKCDFHFYRNPAVATAAIISDGSGRIILIRRGKEPAKGKLGMQGGFVDFGETAEEGLRREVKEETCLAIQELEFLISWPNQYLFQDIIYPTVDFFFTARVPSFSQAHAASEAEGIVICDPREVSLEELAFDSMREALRVYRIKRRL
jgi:ADP-ribose pyrophosphatase YjhB (NUDIX family)